MPARGLQSPVAAFAHGSRVPGWDDAADLDKAPAEVPEPATTAVPADLRAEIEAHMANYPDRRSAVLPALAPPSACTAGARRRRSTRWPR